MSSSEMQRCGATDPKTQSTGCHKSMLNPEAPNDSQRCAQVAKGSTFADGAPGVQRAGGTGDDDVKPRVGLVDRADGR
jgi:hypothetical protein